MFRHLLILNILFIYFSASTSAQGLRLTFDLSNAEQTIGYLRLPGADNQKIKQLLQLPSTRALLIKVRMDSLQAAGALLSVHDSTLFQPAYQKFQYRGIRRLVKEMEAFLHQVRLKQDSIKMEVETALGKYIPAGQTLRIRVSFLLGGNSSGFTLGDDSVFYIGMHHYRSDITGIIESCKHELFHNIQSLYRQHFVITDSLEKRGQEGNALVHYMLTHLFLEGSAEYVADLRKIKDPGAIYIRELRKHAEVNEYRSQEVFYLFSKMLAEAHEHPALSEQQYLYSILFDWNWNNPGYFAGYTITRALCAEYGEDALLKYMKEDPVVFVHDYIRLTRDKKDKYPLRFTEDFEKIIIALAETVKTIKK